TISNFDAPTAMASPPGETNRIFVTQRNGEIYVITGAGTTNAQKSLYMDISGRVLDDGNELGLKGIAFHPDYANNRYVYLSYCHYDGANGRARLSRFQTQAGNPNLGDTGSEQILINQLNNGNVHNVDSIRFGIDGYLYMGIGDQGFVNDQPDGYNNSQKIDQDLWSAILRIDVDKQPGNLEPNPHPGIPVDGGGKAYYAIPADNPFVGATQFNGSAVSPAAVRTEFYVVGLRNPWQFSFDALTDELWVADVGNDAREEVSIFQAGDNGGWVYYEGTLPGPRPDRVPPPGFEYRKPVWEYDHGGGEFQGESITGGFVYRGSQFPDLYGKYLCSDLLSGNIWSIERTSGATNINRIAGQAWLIQFLSNPANEDVLMLNFLGGRILKLAGQTADLPFPETLSETGIFADLADLTPNPGVVGYEPNMAFWSDYAVKSRWFILTNTTDRVTMSREGNWTFPEGMMWVKHFDLLMERGNPATSKRIETRVLVRNASGSYGVSYRWNDAGTEAVLVPDAGVNFSLSITNAGQPTVQQWRIPSRAECLVCHTPAAGHALSFNTRQLNAPGAIASVSNNLIHLLEVAGYTSNGLGDPAELPRHIGPDETEYSLEARARSYLSVNVGYCHMGAAGSVPGAWDGRAFVKLFDTGMILGEAGSNGGNPANKYIVPGDVDHSIIWNRMGESNGFSRMPPLATYELDHTNIALIRDWIVNELPARQSYEQWQIAHFGTTNAPGSGRGDDPDGDHSVNEEEFLAYTSPTNEFDAWSGIMGSDSMGAIVGHDLGNRQVTIEISTNEFQSWSFWPVPGNDGLPIAPGTTRTFDLPDGPQAAGFRFRIEEP
ncbi:MAG: PQQ-dependent sugar dehydrogenase, partial [Kiritimatiellae bacterium]|nr:PQQ-dependent sugar dehydrogenase [Kiritimatiellia bacterium]